MKAGWLVTCVRVVRSRFIALVYAVSPVFLARLRYRMERKVWPDLRQPKIFDEKLVWLMLYWRHPLKSVCGDKYAMREYVERKGCGDVLPDLLGVYESTASIDYNAFPQRFVLKCTHGSHFNIICTDKSSLDIQEACRKLDTWMKTDFSKYYGEIHYKDMKPRIICERFLGGSSGDLPVDYKIFCFDGVAKFIMACRERGLDGYNARYHFYDREWKTRLPFDRHARLDDMDMEKPSTLQRMLEVAERLSQPFPFVRMDFYEVEDQCLLGEMTFTPNGCIDTDFTDEAEKIMGELIRLPAAYP